MGMLNPSFDSRFETASVAIAPGSGFQLMYMYFSSCAVRRDANRSIWHWTQLHQLFEYPRFHPPL